MHDYLQAVPDQRRNGRQWSFVRKLQQIFILLVHRQGQQVQFLGLRANLAPQQGEHFHQALANPSCIMELKEEEVILPLELLLLTV